MHTPTLLVSLEDFKQDWLQEITKGNPSTVTLGNRFARKLVTQWLDFNEDNDDIIFCDGSGDGGIDIAYLKCGDSTEENTSEGHTWYLVQSKYGAAFSGRETLLVEGQKMIETIDGKTRRLSSLASDLVDRLQHFRNSASSKDQLVLLFATIDPLNEDQRRTLSDISVFGKARLGNLFRVESISIETIYQRVLEQLASFRKYQVPLTANLVRSGTDLLVGSVKLSNLYQFLKQYEKETGDLDLIYEKNVRRYLGSGKKVNNEIAQTLISSPERFGLYNNGITIVVEEFAEEVMDKKEITDKFILTEPYIVNGCQTTRTIWNTLYKRLEAGGTGKNNELEEWKGRLSKGIVVVKVVKVGANGDELLLNTTRFTNSQNAVTQKDFLALENGFKGWAKEMASTYDIFLEIQRGGWDSQKTLQRTNPSAKQYLDWVNAFDLLKIYGAAWLGEPGTAFGKNPPFAPGGSIFRRIMEVEGFGIKDLYATYLLHKLGQQIKFGRNRSEEQFSRGQTRYLFFYVLGELLRGCMTHSSIEKTPQNLSDCLIKLFDRFANSDSDAGQLLSNAALDVIDEYLNKDKEDSLFKEASYKEDLNSFLKWDKLGKGSEYTRNLSNLIAFTERDMRRSNGQISVRDQIIQIIGPH